MKLNITDVCNHSLGYIHQYQNREELSANNIINFTKYKLCNQLNRFLKMKRILKNFIAMKTIMINLKF